MNRFTILLAAGVAIATSCSGGKEKIEPVTPHHLAVVDPGHFHAALVSKSPVAALDDTIRLYAPDGIEAIQYTDFISNYNNKAAGPTSWVVERYIGSDFLNEFKADTISDIVVLAGNNRHKTDYIMAAVKASKNVLADKPLAIDKQGFEKLAEAYDIAGNKGLLIYELMTERYDTLNIFTRNLLNSGFLGNIITGSGSPAIEMTSVHHFYKEVSGSPLMRPEWYYDVEQQGEGIADVTTHLLDLIMWQCFPDESIDYRTDVQVIDAGHSATVITPEQFYQSTGVEREEPVEVYSNGYILARIKGVMVKINVQWNFEAPNSSGDTFSAIYRCENGFLRVVQDMTTNFSKEIFITQYDQEDSDEDTHIIVNIPEAARTGHEEHFNLVTGTFLKYIDGADSVPDFEAANTLAKYYITTEAVDIARSKKGAK